MSPPGIEVVSPCLLTAAADLLESHVHLQHFLINFGLEVRVRYATRLWASYVSA
jgi:hypothetical protein